VKSPTLEIFEKELDVSLSSLNKDGPALSRALDQVVSRGPFQTMLFYHSKIICIHFMSY